MFYRWLDRWDERRASRGDEYKKVTSFGIGAEFAFPGANQPRDVTGFCELAGQIARDASYFEAPSQKPDSFERKGEWLTFQSDISTEIDNNNVVWSRISECGSKDRALVVFHHWNATRRNSQLAKFFSRSGITVVEIAMPYHLERRRAGSHYADYMLSGNLGRTAQSVRQAVLDGRKLVRWLKREGYKDISVLGMSLGSWIAGLVAAHDTAVSKASLLLTAGSLAEMVWTGRATRSIRETFEAHLNLNDLRKAWAPLSLECYTHELSRPGLDLQIVLAKRDSVVLPELSERLIYKLRQSGAEPEICAINCGHYSLSLPPYIVVVGLELKRFLTKP